MKQCLVTLLLHFLGYLAPQHHVLDKRRFLGQFINWPPESFPFHRLKGFGGSTFQFRFPDPTDEKAKNLGPDPNGSGRCPEALSHSCLETSHWPPPPPDYSESSGPGLVFISPEGNLLKTVDSIPPLSVAPNAA